MPAPSNPTIGNWGCLLTVYCNQANYLGLTKDTLDKFNERLVSAGAFSGPYIKPGALAIAFPAIIVYDGFLQRGDALNRRIKAYIDNNKPVPIRVDFHPETAQWDQHWVLAIGYTDSDFIIADPWHGDEVLLSDRYNISGDDVLEGIFYTLRDVPPPDPPQPGRQLNIRRYFEPSGDVGPFKVLSWLDGSKTQNQQLLKRGGHVIEAKGGGQWIDGRQYFDYERYQFRGGEMIRWEDTSMGNNQGYTQHGARWLPEIVTLGQPYVNMPRITIYNRANCNVVSDSTTTDYLTCYLVPHWESPYGFRYNDVLKIEWRKSAGGAIQEVYYYGLGEGLIGWGIGTLQAAISEKPQGRAPINPQLWTCS